MYSRNNNVGSLAGISVGDGCSTSGVVITRRVETPKQFASGNGTWKPISNRAVKSWLICQVSNLQSEMIARGFEVE